MTAPPTPHVGDEDIALILEGVANESERERIVRHLRECTQCRELYDDAAIELSLLDAGAVPAELDGEIPDLGRRVAGPIRTSAAKRSSAPWWRGRMGALAAAAVVVVVASVLWFDSIPEGDGLSAEVVAPIRSAVETASGWGTIIVPGGEATSTNTGTPYRSGFVTPDPDLEAALDQLYEQYNADASLSTARWLSAGYLVTGQLDIARDIALDARRRVGQDNDLLIIEALISYAHGDLSEAETTLRRVIADDPSNSVANLNLAVVLNDTGRTSEATELLQQLLSQSPNEAIASRALALLASY